jgi:hypothetical protein
MVRYSHLPCRPLGVISFLISSDNDPNEMTNNYEPIGNQDFEYPNGEYRVPVNHCQQCHDPVKQAIDGRSLKGSTSIQLSFKSLELWSHSLLWWLMP